MLLNVGPDPDGVIPATHVTRLEEIGNWLNKKYLWHTSRAISAG